MRTSAWLVAFTLAAGCGDPGAGGPDAALDAPSLDAGKDAACASSFGDALTAAFGRVDGTVVAVVAPGTERCAMPNRDHVIVQVEFGGAVYRMVVNVLSNGGGQFPAPAQHISANGFAAVVKNNLLGTWNVTREVANQAMIPRKRGRIVNVIANIYRGFPGMVHTGAARAGVENMTMSLAVEWSQFGILVNAVAPGVIISSGTKRYPPEIVARSVSRTPLKRAGTVDEVAASIVFLASPAAQFITGTTLRIDGGQALWGDTWELP